MYLEYEELLHITKELYSMEYNYPEIEKLLTISPIPQEENNRCICCNKIGIEFKIPDNRECLSCILLTDNSNGDNTCTNCTTIKKNLIDKNFNSIKKCIECEGEFSEENFLLNLYKCDDCQLDLFEKYKKSKYIEDLILNKKSFPSINSIDSYPIVLTSSFIPN
jgi:hypothetical protein